MCVRQARQPLWYSAVSGHYPTLPQCCEPPQRRCSECNLLHPSDTASLMFRQSAAEITAAPQDSLDALLGEVLHSLAAAGTLSDKARAQQGH